MGMMPNGITSITHDEARARPEKSLRHKRANRVDGGPIIGGRHPQVQQIAYYITASWGVSPARPPWEYCVSTLVGLGIGVGISLPCDVYTRSRGPEAAPTPMREVRSTQRAEAFGCKKNPPGDLVVSGCLCVCMYIYIYIGAYM